MIITKNKMVIYQVLPRLFGNDTKTLKFNGTIEENGVGKLNDFTPKALKAIKALGVTHIWYTGVLEHATKTKYEGIEPDPTVIVKGNAGSPYAIKDYYDIDPDLAVNVAERKEEFRALVKRTHAEGMKVIIDFVPNHVSRHYQADAMPEGVCALGEADDTSQAFNPNNNFYYIPNESLHLPFSPQEGEAVYDEYPAKVTGNDHFDAYPSETDWYEAAKLNYGVDYLDGAKTYFDPIPDTWKKMLDILCYWVGFGVDAFRCDMVEMVPVDFWHWVIPQVKAQNQTLEFIAEVYQPDRYHAYINEGGFDYLYNKVGLYDTLKAIMCKTAPASDLTKRWQEVDAIQAHMLNFLENHDEVRIGSRYFVGDPMAAMPAMVVSTLMHSNPIMIYSGQEFGEQAMNREGFGGSDGRTTIFDYWSVQTVREWRNGGRFDGAKMTEEAKQYWQCYADIIQLASTDPVMINGDFYDLGYANAANAGFDRNCLFAFMRHYKNEVLLIVVNFSGEKQKACVKIPEDVFKALDFAENTVAKVSQILPISEKTSIGTLTSAWPYEIKINGYESKIIRFTY